MFSKESKLLMQCTVPSGYQIITQGTLQVGDIRWNRWLDQWNLQDITQSPKHDLVIGDQISSFAGVCRKIQTNTTSDEELLTVCQL